MQIDVGFLCLEIKERPFLYAMAISFVMREERNVKSVVTKGEEMHWEDQVSFSML